MFRQAPVLRGQPIRTGDQVRDIAWLTPAGKEMTPEDWGAGFGKCVAVFLNGDAIPTPNARGERVVDDSFLLCFNAHDKPVKFVTPDSDYAEEWTASARHRRRRQGRTRLVVKAGKKFPLQARSLLVLRKTA